MLPRHDREAFSPLTRFEPPLPPQKIPKMVYHRCALCSLCNSQVLTLLKIWTLLSILTRLTILTILTISTFDYVDTFDDNFETFIKFEIGKNHFDCSHCQVSIPKVKIFVIKNFFASLPKNMCCKGSIC